MRWTMPSHAYHRVQRLVVPVEVAEVRAAGHAHHEIRVGVGRREARRVGVERPPGGATAQERREREDECGEHPPTRGTAGRNSVSGGTVNPVPGCCTSATTVNRRGRASRARRPVSMASIAALIATVVAVLVHDEHVRDAGAAHAGGRSAQGERDEPDARVGVPERTLHDPERCREPGAHRRAHDRPGLPVPAAPRGANGIRRVRRFGCAGGGLGGCHGQAPRCECVLEAVEHMTGAGAVRLDRRDVVPGLPEPVREVGPRTGGGDPRAAHGQRRTAPDGPGRSGAAHHRAGSTTGASATARRRPPRARAPRTRTRGRPRVRRCRRATPPPARRHRGDPRRRWRVRSASATTPVYASTGPPTRHPSRPRRTRARAPTAGRRSPPPAGSHRSAARPSPSAAAADAPIRLSAPSGRRYRCPPHTSGRAPPDGEVPLVACDR